MSYVGSCMRGDIFGLERQRFWRDEDKLKFITPVGFGGATVTQAALRHEVTRQQIYAWWRDLKEKGLWSPERCVSVGHASDCCGFSVSGSNH